MSIVSIIGIIQRRLKAAKNDLKRLQDDFSANVGKYDFNGYGVQCLVAETRIDELESLLEEIDRL